MDFLVTPLQQITPDLTQSRNTCYLTRYSEQVTHWKNEETGFIPGRDGAVLQYASCRQAVRPT